MTKYLKSDAKMELCYNIKYMPWLNGIEYTWRDAKAIYRKKLLGLRVRDEPFKNLDLVNQCLDQLSHA